MTWPVAFLLSFLLGFYIVKCFKEGPLSLTDVFVIPGVGLAMSAQIVFYVLLCTGRINPLLIWLAHVLALGGLVFYRRRRTTVAADASSRSQEAVMAAVLGLAALLAVAVAWLRPWGGWDGWAYWNYRAVFFFKSGYHWPLMFLWNMQPRHPWAVPLMIVWGWNFSLHPQLIVPLALGVIFTVLTIGLLIAVLKKYASLGLAVLAGMYLLSIPYYLIAGTSQYADIIGAYFILLSLASAVELLERPCAADAAWTGLCLGLSATIKDNNLVASLMLTAGVVTVLWRHQRQDCIRPLAAALISVGTSVVAMRTLEGFYSAFHPYHIAASSLRDGHRWLLMGQFVLRTLVSPHWGGLWLMMVLWAVLSRFRRPNRVRDFGLVLAAAYVIFYFFVFVISGARLEWLLKVSFDRMLFPWAPALIFVMFSALPKKE